MVWCSVKEKTQGQQYLYLTFTLYTTLCKKERYR